MPQDFVEPYEGREPYVFISYSHRDSDRVQPILRRLRAEGFRFWYDEGIDPGTEWPEAIATHLAGSKVCLAFISKSSIESRNCRREINFALSRNLGFLSVILEPCEMSPGMEMQISSYQALMRYAYTAEEKFYDRLLRLDVLQSCREGAAPEEERRPEKPTAVTETQPAPAPSGKKKSGLGVGLAAAAVLLLIVGLILAKLPRRDAAEAPAAAETTTQAATATPASVAADIPDSGAAAENPEFTISASGTAGDISWSLEDGVLTLVGSGMMADYGGDFGDAPWHDNRDAIRSVIIEPGITSIGTAAFCECTALKEISIPDSVTVIGDNAFNYTGLTDITIPEGVERIGGTVFWNNFYLATITIPSTVSYIGNCPVANCPVLSSITVSEGNKAYASADGVLFDKEQTVLICYPAKKEGKTYEIPDSVVRIGASAFNHADLLWEVTIPEGVTTIGGSAFEDCSNLSTVEIPRTVDSIGPFAFATCKKLSEFVVAEGNKAYTSVDGVLFNKRQEELLICPEAKRGSYVIPEGVKVIEERAFTGCTYLESIAIPDSVTMIRYCAFQYCSGLTSISLPDNIDTISEDVFEGCSNLQTVTIPASVKTVYDNAFANCVRLTTVNYGGSETQWRAVQIRSGNDPLLSAAITYNAK